MNRKSKIIVSVVGIFIVLLALLGITYGYFLTRIVGNTNDTSISITTANLSIIYDDNNSQINATNIQPGDTVYTKTFTVTNEGNDEIEYAVYLENIINDFVHYDDLQFYITCESSIVGNTCNGYYGKDKDDNGIIKFDGSDAVAIYPKTSVKLLTNTISPKEGNTPAEVHTYTLYLNFRDNGNQSDDMGKIISGKIQIYDPKSIIAISGNVTVPDGDNTKYYVELHSDVKISQIASDGTYIFEGVTPEEHTLYVKYIDEDGAEQIKGSQLIKISKGESASITLSNDNKSSIVVNKSVVNANINITVGSTEISLSDGNLKTLGGFKEGTLAAKILADNELKNGENLDFSKVEDGLYYTGKNTEDNKITYFYRGNVDNNYVVFGGNKSCIYKGVLVNGNISSKDECLATPVYGISAVGDTYYIGYETIEECNAAFLETGAFCIETGEYATWSIGQIWKIVRINEDGSVRLLYYGNNIEDNTPQNIITTPYGGIGPGADRSFLFTNLYTWYENNLLSFSDKLVDSGFCADGSYKLSIIECMKNYIYGPNSRISNNIAQYKCPDNKDLYTMSSNLKGNGRLTYPIGLITADEVTYAGINYFDEENNRSYLSNYQDSYTLSILHRNEYHIDENVNNIVSFDISYGFIDGTIKQFSMEDELSYQYQHPVINIKGDLNVTGNGTVETPYIIN